MSWKGLQKAVNRLPFQILSKKSETTKDPEYLALEKKFKEISKHVEALSKDASTFRDSIAALLSNQAAMAEYLSIIYDNNIGIQVPEGTVPKRFQQTPATNLQAINDAEAAMAYCRDEVLPELDTIDRDVVRPLLELAEIVKTIHKTMVKRDHKLIDFDRHRVALQKLNNKTERSFSEEKQIFKIQSQLDVATQDYNYLNDLLKRDLPTFFQLKATFIQPVFENLYEMQCKIYGMIYARCYELLNQNLEVFVTHTAGIEEGYNYRKSQRDVRNEMESLDLLRAGGKAWISVSGGQNSSKLSLQDRAALRAAENATTNGTSGSYPSAYPTAPPAYGASNDVTVDATPVSYGKQSYNQSAAQYVIALYDYSAQADGDLSFRKDDKIEIIERTQDQNDWWTGRLNGVIGVFPGNYVAEH